MRCALIGGRTLPRTLLIGLLQGLVTTTANGAQAATAATDAARPLVVPTRPAAPEAAPEAAPQGGEPCFPVRQLHIKGVSLIDQGALRRRLEPLAMSCINTASATAIVLAINEAHADKGYITTQGYLPAQDIRTTGVLEIDVVTGRIGAITYTEKTDKNDAGYLARLGKAFDAMRNSAGLWGLANGVSDLGHTLVSPLGQPRLLNGDAHRGFRLWSASGMTPGDVLHVDAVQGGLDAINSVSSSRAEAKLTPGKEPGTSDIAIVNMPYRPLRLSGGYELNGKSLNQPGETSGSRLRVDLARDNLIGVNDTWSAALASGENSNEARGGVSIPLRKLTLSAFAGYSEQLTAATATTAYFFQTTTASGAASYVLAQDRNSKTSLDASLSWRQLRRSVNSFRLTPQTIAPARIGLSRIHMWQGDPESRLTGAQVSYAIGVSRGLTIWRATRDGWRPGQDAPRAQFWKLDGAFGVAQGIRDVGVIRLDVTGQWTRHPLYADDQLSLGSIDTVRGFANNLIRVDRGVVARAEFAPTLPVARMFARPEDKAALPFLHDMLSALQPYAFADLGHGRDIANRADITRVGLGAGVRFTSGRTSFNASVAHPVLERGTPKGRRGPEVNLSLSFSLL